MLAIFSGNFDRYSATRRTRRYKKTQDSAGDKDASSPELVCDEKPTVQRPSTLALADEDTRGDEDAMLRIWQDKLKRRDIIASSSSSSSRDIDAALAEIARSGEDLQRLSTTTTETMATTTTTTTTGTTSHRNSRLPISQPPPPVVAVTNTVLSPVMQESRPREPVTVLAERAVTSRERHRSMIDPSQVKEAVRLTSNPPSQVNQEQETSSRSFRSENSLDDASRIMEDEQRAGDPRSVEGNLEKDVRSADDLRDRTLMTRQNSMFRSRFIPDISVTSSPPSSGKVTRDQELNDEGFEETQSLVSETLSQETSSGNYETDTHDSTRCSPAELSYGGEQHRRSITKTMDDDDDLNGRGNRRSLSVDKLSKPTSGKVFDKKETASRNASGKSSFLPTRAAGAKRESALKKTESLKKSSSVAQSLSRAPSKNEVQRSGSRSSLRSSRSSLNSATSVNTVRNLAANHSHLRNYTSAIRALTNDLRKSSPSSSPLPPKNVVDKRRLSPRHQVSVSRIPASRSSSSGSSVGPTARSLRKAPEVGTRVQISTISRRFFEKSI